MATGRKRGGKPGQPGHERPEFAPMRIDRLIEYRPDTCPFCGEPLVDRGTMFSVESLTRIELAPNLATGRTANAR